jgi:hypothetical protein
MNDDRSYYFDRDGKPLTRDEWLHFWWSVPFDDYRRVAVDQIGPFRISTVWLGVNDGSMGIFETRFEYDDGGAKYYRSSTESEARDQHAYRVRAACATLGRMATRLELDLTGRL